jgi:hypothetical protein
MYSSPKREMLTGLQYLLIGFIALCVVFRWFSGRPPIQQMLVWGLIAAAMSFVRFIIIFFSEWMRRDQWKTVSRRNWSL